MKKIDAIVEAIDQMKGEFTLHDIRSIAVLHNHQNTSKSVSCELSRLADRGVIIKIKRVDWINHYRCVEDVTARELYEVLFSRKKTREIRLSAPVYSDYQFLLGSVRMKAAENRFFAA